MSKKILVTEAAPAAIGAYSQGIATGNFVYTSGQLPVDVKTGEMPATAGEQAAKCMENVKAVLAAGGATLQDVVKITIFVKDLSKFNEINDAYKACFSGDFPARSCVEVARLPKDALVEIEAIAVVK
ncbi:hypothetical protein AAG570_014021 [Ranatra chinensis]|uniref:Uncharacterized protein n=1 Tax=Ranatra chinensis TaxID=642074 RepID=A0ABD0XS41_9HEMI